MRCVHYFFFKISFFFFIIKDTNIHSEGEVDIMLITKKVEVTCGSRNKEYYEKLGYGPLKHGDTFEIDIKHLTVGSSLRVMAKCEYCQVEKEVIFNDYNKQKNKHITKKYACKKCLGKKFIDGANIKNEKEGLKEDARAFYSIKKHRVDALKSYIQEHGTIAGMSKHNWYKYFLQYEENVFDEIERLGYGETELKNILGVKFWENFDRVKNKMESFLHLYKRYPNRQEMEHELEFHSHAIRKHGGLREIKRKMEKEIYLLDRKGEKHYFLGEWMTANFLIQQQIPYKRNQLLVVEDEKGFRSDFTFYPVNQQPVHVELWGYANDDNSEAAMYYRQKRKEKEAFYHKYGVLFLGVEYEIFEQSEEKINETFLSLFDSYLSMNMNPIGRVSISQTEKMTDEELLEVVMSYSDNKDYVPSVYEVRKNEQEVYNEILKRYRNFRLFADKFQKKMVSRSTYYWTKEKVEERFLYMINTYQKICSENELRKTEDYRLKGLYKAIYKFGGMTYHRLLCYRTCLEKTLPIPHRELNYIRSRRIRGTMPIDSSIEKIIEHALKEHAPDTVNV